MMEPRIVGRIEELANDYANAEPFPHAVIENLFDAATLDDILDTFPSPDAAGWRRFDNENERKHGYTGELALPDPALRFLWYLSSPAVLGFLERLTGIDGLVPDPYFGGGGLHLIERGGFLDMHVDFNLHPKLKLHRRLNMLVYLNRDWQREHGGCLILRSADGEREKEIVPRFNTTVVFSTTEESWHGHPEPVTHDAPSPRRSVSTYYYTAAPPPEPAAPHDTIFRP